MKKYAIAGSIPEMMLIISARTSIAPSPNILFTNGIYTSRIGKTTMTATDSFDKRLADKSSLNGSSPKWRSTINAAVQKQYVMNEQLLANPKSDSLYINKYDAAETIPAKPPNSTAPPI